MTSFKKIENVTQDQHCLRALKNSGVSFIFQESCEEGKQTLGKFHSLSLPLLLEKGKVRARK